MHTNINLFKVSSNATSADIENFIDTSNMPTNNSSIVNCSKKLKLISPPEVFNIAEKSLFK